MVRFKKSYKLFLVKKCYFFILFLISLFFVGYYHRNNIAYIVGFIFLNLIFFFSCLARNNIKRVDFDIFFPKRIFANTPFKIVLKFKKRVYDIEVFNKHFKVAEGLEEVEFLIKKRGEFEFKDVKITSHFPFCFIAKKIKEINKKIIVYPEIKGEDLKFFKNRGSNFEEFNDLKRYEGESLSLIHWGSVAKGEILSKKFNSFDEKELIFDYSKIKGDKEFRLSQLTKWILEAEKQNLKFKVILGNEIIENKDIDEILKKIALY